MLTDVGLEPASLPLPSGFGQWEALVHIWALPPRWLMVSSRWTTFPDSSGAHGSPPIQHTIILSICLSPETAQAFVNCLFMKLSYSYPIWPNWLSVSFLDPDWLLSAQFALHSTAFNKGSWRAVKCDALPSYFIWTVEGWPMAPVLVCGWVLQTQGFLLQHKLSFKLFIGF